MTRNQRPETGFTILVLRACLFRITLSGVKTLTVKLPEMLFAEIASAAAARNIPKSEIVRERLSQAGGGGLSLWSQMEDLVIEDQQLPHDLSSNKTHLRGYGQNRADR